jgi:hypothetical protein
VSSVPVNTAENGFIVHIDGNASFVLTYSPDQLYNLGKTISLASALVIVVPAVFYFIWGNRSRDLLSLLHVRRKR